ncbi:hypothetical protein [Fulvivirga sediminis]|uniref:Uncharacterized protein n=1 Tax=Fulvivirga sediminis TaxID=2803949 RepID=A0A937F967_9BACT|nr:hypothetical protein [Fulvivirga sediminis]MBL3658626.1 hypothetical protein [Fulvivirga sediminis]
MNDSIKQNRDLRNKRKSLKDIYEHEHKSHTDHFNEADVNERVSLRLKREREQSSRNRRLSVLLFLSIIIGFITV